MKFAIIQTGSKQYRVEEGATLKVEKLDIETGKPVVFDRVLLTYDEKEGARVGMPYIEGMEVGGTVLSQAKHPKIIVFKYKAKKRYRKKTGHRQPFTLVKITHLGAKEEEKSKPESKRKVRSAKTPKKAAPKKTAKRSQSKTRT